MEEVGEELLVQGAFRIQEFRVDVEEVDALAGLFAEVRTRFGLSILLVEHHMSLVMRVSDKVVALNFGRKIADGTPYEVRSNPDVIRAYLGEGADAA